MTLRGGTFAAAAAGIAILLALASSVCVVNCLAADNPAAPPCHRHAPSNAKDFAHTGLTATVRCAAIAMEAPAAWGRTGAVECLAAAHIADAAPSLTFASPPVDGILRI